MAQFQTVEQLIQLSPDEMKNSQELARLATFLKNTLRQNVGVFRVCNLYKALCLPIPAELDIKEVLAIGKLLEMSCYIYAPNRCIHGTAFTIDDKICISPSMEQPRITQPFAIMSLVLQLGAIISQCDSDIDPREYKFLENIVSTREFLTEIQAKSLHLWLQWCLNTRQKLGDLEKRLNNISEALRNQISDIVIQVACADGKITPEEHDMLVRIHRAMHLTATWVDLCLSERNCKIIPSEEETLTMDEIRELDSMGPSPSIQVNSIMSSPTLPCLAPFSPNGRNKPVEQPKQSIQAEPVEPDEEAVLENSDRSNIRISMDLNNALNALGNIKSMDDFKALTEESPKSTGIPSSSTPTLSKDAKVLDADHIEFLRRICEKSTLPRFEVFRRAMDCKLMGDWAMYTINQAFIQRKGLSIIEDGDPVQINTVRAKELLHDVSEK